ncbi:MAG: acetylglutamate kinase [Myxococcota bacterium]
MDLRTRAIIARLLGNLGSRSEVEQYLKHYGADGRKSAVINVAGEVLDENLEDVASSLAFLGEVGLQPIVVHGAQPQIEAGLRARSIISPTVDGQGVMTPEVLDTARRISLRVNNDLVEALENLGVRARSLTAGVFRAEALDGRLGLAGQPVTVDEEPLRWALAAGAVPVVSALGETDGGQILSLDPAPASRILAGTLRPHKTIFLRSQGGLRRRNERLISAVNLAEDYEDLASSSELSPDVKSELGALYELLMELPPESSVSFTSPSLLARELFTHTGAGTFVRLGVRVHAYRSFDEVDRPRLRRLLETCFGKQLHPGYFEDREAHRIYLSDDYRAVAVVVDLGMGVPYLDKFAVTAAAQGEGLGASVWRRLRGDEPRLFWRARTDNPVNPWYFRNAQGSYQDGDWVVFWYGFDSYGAASACVERALSLPATFREPART